MSSLKSFVLRICAVFVARLHAWNGFYNALVLNCKRWAFDESLASPNKKTGDCFRNRRLEIVFRTVAVRRTVGEDASENGRVLDAACSTLKM